MFGKQESLKKHFHVVFWSLKHHLESKNGLFYMKSWEDSVAIHSGDRLPLSGCLRSMLEKASKLRISFRVCAAKRAEYLEVWSFVG